MNSYWDIQRIQSEGLLCVSIGKRMITGKLLRLSGYKQIVDGITDLATLEKYSEVEIAGLNGAPPTYILARSLAEYPQICLGYQKNSGFAIFVGVQRALEGLMTIVGLPRSGKSTMLASILYQVLRLGYP